jgi:hypothetical protein
MWASMSKTVGLEPPEPLGAHNLLQCVMDARHRDLGFSVCLVGFQYCLGPIPPFYFLILSF